MFALFGENYFFVFKIGAIFRSHLAEAVHYLLNNRLSEKKAAVANF